MLSDLTPHDDEPSKTRVDSSNTSGTQLNQKLLVLLLLISSISAGFLAVSNLKKTSENQKLEIENQQLSKQAQGLAAELPDANRGSETPPIIAAAEKSAKGASEEEGATPAPSNPLSDAATATLSSPEYGADGFEATNLKIQQAVVVELADGRLQKILLEIPVLYESRQLRMDAKLTRELRQLRDQVVNHQSKMRNLRSEGALLLSTWNRFLNKTTPAPALRADSITLPANQGPQAPNRFSKPLKSADIKPSKQP